MNYYSKICIVLLKIIISNVITVYTIDEFKQIIENQTSLTINDLNILIREYPAFIQLKLQKQDYYTGKDVSRCPMPYNENTILDDPDVELFNPRKCKKPWTWMQKNEIEVHVPINGTIGKKLGEIIQPCLKNNTNIIQCYTHYLNVIESVGLTFVDRFCLFQIEIWDRVLLMVSNIDHTEKFSLFNIKQNIPVIFHIVDNFRHLLDNIYIAFKQYNISTLPLDCVVKVTEKMFKIKYNARYITQRKQFLNCRELMKSKLNYAVIDNVDYWDWDIKSYCKPEDTVLMNTQYKNDKLGLNLFPNKDIKQL